LLRVLCDASKRLAKPLSMGGDASVVLSDKPRNVEAVSFQFKNQSERESCARSSRCLLLQLFDERSEVNCDDADEPRSGMRSRVLEMFERGAISGLAV
jgi:hypothetical protein